MEITVYKFLNVFSIKNLEFEHGIERDTYIPAKLGKKG
jgi:hypothetical protein